MQTWIDEVYSRILAKMPYGAEMAARQGTIPYQGKGESWDGPPFEGDAWWTNGFWPASMWLLHGATGDAAYAEEARRVQRLLAIEQDHYTNLHHDVGFQFLLSYGVEHVLTGDAEAHRRTLQAAGVLAGRFNPNGFIRAWNGEGREGWAIVDCLMNLPLLYWASRETGDPRYGLIARLHADTAIRHFLRADGSCNHIVIFDALTGAVLDTPGGQGYAKGSSWSRGQAWALYGFTLSYRNTGESRYLAAARRVADYFTAHIRPDGLTDCDFCQPEGEERIDNIAGACAASGLLDLADVSHGADAARYRDAALRMLRGIDRLCADWNPARCGILTKCTASYHDDGAGRHINIVYGDYFFMEAILKLRGLDFMPWKPARGEAG